MANLRKNLKFHEEQCALEGCAEEVEFVYPKSLCANHWNEWFNHTDQDPQWMEDLVKPYKDEEQEKLSQEAFEQIVADMEAGKDE